MPFAKRLDSGQLPEDVLQRVYSRLSEWGEGHLLWRGAVTSRGYPVVNAGKQFGNIYVRRLMAARARPLPAGAKVLRGLACPSRCVAPDHSERSYHSPGSKAYPWDGLQREQRSER